MNLRQAVKTGYQLGLAVVLLSLLWTMPAQAATPTPGASSGSVGLEGKISTDAPKQAATITTPANGATFDAVPITVNGLCPKGLLVKVFSNNIFVGSVQCDSGSYSIQVNLFSGLNELVVRVYDALDQAGPDSNLVTIRFNDAQFAQFGTQVSLSSEYAKRGASPGSELQWPILLSGGTGPYAFSVDWGDGSPTDLLSEPFGGIINIKHTYKAAGVYKIIVKVTDANGDQAFLQLVGVGTGRIAQDSASSAASSSGTSTRTVVIWWPALAMLPLIVATFWIGRRHELYTLRKQLEKNRQSSL